MGPEMEVGSSFSGRAEFGPGFGPNFPKRNRAQSGLIEGTLANNFFSFGHISQSYPKLLENCWQRSALALSRSATFPPMDWQ